jgi:hypothetical protein
MVRDLLGLDQGYARLTDSDIDNYLDEAFVLMSTELVLPRLSVEFALPVTAGQSMLELDSSVLRILDVTINDNSLDATSLQRTVVESPYWRTENGEPRQYWETPASASGRMQIRIHPPAQSSGTVYVNAVVTPQRVAAYDDMEIYHWPPLARYAACYYAAWRSAGRASEIVPADARQSWFETYQRYTNILDSSAAVKSAQKVEIERAKEPV